MADEHDDTRSFSERVSDWERATDEAANKLMGTEAFSEWVNGLQSNQLAMQKAYAEAMTQQMHVMNMPTRHDVVRLAETIQQMDRRLERMERLMLRLAKLDRDGGQAQAEGPVRTRKPPADDDQGDS